MRAVTTTAARVGSGAPHTRDRFTSRLQDERPALDRRIVDAIEDAFPEAVHALGRAPTEAVIEQCTDVLVLGLGGDISTAVRAIAPVAGTAGSRTLEVQAPLEQVTAAIGLYQRLMWEETARIAAGLDVPAAFVTELAAEGMQFATAFVQRTVKAHAEALARRDAGRQHLRQQLLTDLLRGVFDPTGVEARASACGWHPPASARVAIAAAEEETAWPAGALDGRWGSYRVAVLAAEPDALLAASCGPLVALDDLPASLDAAVRLHALPRGPAPALVRWEDHLLALMLTADPRSATAFADRELAPLDVAPVRQQAWLGETLAAWLDHTGSPTRIARVLHLHPQSARYRLTHLRDAFGDRLDDAEARLRLRLALEIRGIAAASHAGA